MSTSADSSAQTRRPTYIRDRSFPADPFVGSPAHVASVMEKGAG